MDGQESVRSALTGLGTSVARTLIPYVAGGVISVLATLNLPFALPDDAQHLIETGLTVVIGTTWYLLVRLLESRWPRMGVLLGAPRPPSYMITGDGGEREEEPAPPPRGRHLA